MSSSGRTAPHSEPSCWATTRPRIQWVTLTRDLLLSGQLPAVDATNSGSRLELGEHTELASAARESVSKRSLAGASVLAFLRQWFAVAEPWTGQPGEYVSLDQTLSGTRQFIKPRT